MSLVESASNSPLAREQLAAASTSREDPSSRTKWHTLKTHGRLKRMTKKGNVRNEHNGREESSPTHATQTKRPRSSSSPTQQLPSFAAVRFDFSSWLPSSTKPPPGRSYGNSFARLHFRAGHLLVLSSRRHGITLRQIVRGMSVTGHCLRVSPRRRRRDRLNEGARRVCAARDARAVRQCCRNRLCIDHPVSRDVGVAGQGA